MNFTEFILVALLLSLFHVVLSTNSSIVYVNPVVLDSCSSPLASTSGASSDTNEALREALTSYLERSYGNGCGGAGWTRMVYFNAADTTTRCPANWRLHPVIRGCGRSTNSSYTCDSVYFSNAGLSYNRVCGRIVAYQRGSPEAFFANNHNNGERSIETAYASGVLLTHGPVGSRKHIWTFAAALFKQSSLYQATHRMHVCPCTTPALSWPYLIPQFVGNNYFCDSSNPGPAWSHTTLYPQDPLWDGVGCPSTSSCCQFNTPPWFYSFLPETTTDDMEVRLCSGNGDEDMIISLIELYASV